MFALMTALTLSAAADKLALTPPMGWMSWEVFRCDIDCAKNPAMCVGEVNYKQQADALVSGGFRAAGYKTISIDDCWEEKVPARDSQGRLAPDKIRFPSGFKALADHMHAQNVSFGIYSDMGTRTCGGYPGSQGHEEIDAKTFAECASTECTGYTRLHAPVPLPCVLPRAAQAGLMTVCSVALAGGVDYLKLDGPCLRHSLSLEPPSR